MNTVLDVITVYGALWLVLSVVVAVTILYAGTRDEPPLEDEPEGEVVYPDFARNGNEGRAA